MPELTKEQKLEIVYQTIKDKFNGIPVKGVREVADACPEAGTFRKVSLYLNELVDAGRLQFEKLDEHGIDRFRWATTDQELSRVSSEELADQFRPAPVPAPAPAPKQIRLAIRSTKKMILLK